jgi:simple sugar transport system ATP-binding protein
MTEAPEFNGDILQVEHISKNYGVVTALTDVNLRLAKGEVLGLIGDNGAGKSTLLKILCGFQQPSSGRIVLEGQDVRFKSVDHARSLGIDAVYQDLALIPQLTVAQNMFLNREKVSWPLLNIRAMRREAQEHLDEIGVRIGDINAPVARLSGGQRQAVAVARAVMWAHVAVLMDEPTAALGARQSEIVCDLMRTVAERGLGVLVVSHDLPRVLKVADRVTVLWRGATALDTPAEGLTVPDVVATMVGFRKGEAA